MTLKILVAASILAMATGAARAEGEGNGEPFVFRIPGTVTALVATPAPNALASAQPSPNLPPRAAMQARRARNS